MPLERSFGLGLPIVPIAATELDVAREAFAAGVMRTIKREAGAGGKAASLRDPARRDKRDHSALFVGQSDRRIYALIFFKRNRRMSRQDDRSVAQKFISAPIPT
jgi:hypothetical protein